MITLKYHTLKKSLACVNRPTPHVGLKMECLFVYLRKEKKEEAGRKGEVREEKESKEGKDA